MDKPVVPENDITLTTNIITVVIVVAAVGLITFCCSFIGKFVALKIAERSRRKRREFEARKRQILSVSEVRL